jgi:hypothetical protein
MRLAYRLLVERSWLDEKELELLEAWLNDVEEIAARSTALPTRAER